MNVHDYSARRIDGQDTSLSEFRGRALLIVNTASKCGLTPQYKELQALYETYRERGLEVLGFPCNQFGGQEPGTEADIQTFCETNYQVSFPLFSKIEVNGPGTHPLYEHLKSATPETQDIEWNFAKFLVDRAGKVVRRYSPQTAPSSIAPDVEQTLAQA